METNILFEELNKNNINECIKLCLKLWNDNTKEDLFEEFIIAIDNDREKIFLCKIKEKYVAFIHVSIRRDYVEGCISKIVSQELGYHIGFIEGIYVEPDYRRIGIAKNLINISGDWTRNNGCTEMGSDFELNNIDSLNLHLKSDYEEKAILRHFLKRL